MKAQDNTRADESTYPQMLLDFAQAVMRRDQDGALRILEESARLQAGAGNTKMSKQIKDVIVTLLEHQVAEVLKLDGGPDAPPAPATVSVAVSSPVPQALAGVSTAPLQPSAASLPAYLQLPDNWTALVNDLKVRGELFRHDILSSSSYIFPGTWKAARATAAYLAHALNEKNFRHSPLEAMLVREGEHAVELFTQAAAATEPPSVHLVEWADVDFGQRYPHLAAANARI